MEQYVLAPSVRAAVVAHYERAADLIAANFPLAPVVRAYYPDGIGTEAHYGGPVYEPLPDAIPSVEVGEPPHVHRYVAVSPDSILWLVDRAGTVGLCSWTPSPRDPESVGFARIILSPRGGATPEQISLAMLAVRTALFQRGVETIPVLDGFAGAALFIPFGDVPTYEAVREWLHIVVNGAVKRNPTLLTANEREQKNDLVHINVGSNAVGRFSSLPYALIGSPQLGMVTPIEWSELGTVANGHYTAANSAERFAQGDVFQRLAAELASQRFADVRR